MSVGLSHADRRLADFEWRYSPPGLLQAYAHSRLSHFFMRQFLMLIAAVLLAFLISPVTGLAIACLVLGGEALDCLFLLGVKKRLAQGTPPARLVLVSTLTATLQSSTVALCVALTWYLSPDNVASGFAMTFLMAAAINAGLVLPYNRPATVARLAVFALTAGVLILDALAFTPGPRHKAAADLGAMLIMGFVSYLFLHYTLTTFRARQRKNRDLLIYGRDLAHANLHLEGQQKEMRRLSLVAKHANDSVLITDAARRILWVNDAFTRLTGYTLEEVKGHSPPSFTAAPGTSQETLREIDEALAAGRPHRTQILNKTKDGRLIWIGTNIVPLLDEAGDVDVVIAIERDITDLKRHESELADAMAAAKSAADAKARFLATMSHEIRTPMNGIIGMAELLAEEPLSPENQQYVNTIRRSGEALLTIINDVLDFSKLQAGAPTLHAVAFDPRLVLDDAVNLMTPQARKKGLVIDVTLPPDLPARVLGDDGRLRQILVNILGNAIKFTETGGISITLHCERDSADNTLRLTIKVRDSGIGIAPDRIDHVFNEFAQGDSATTRQFGGTGLGLPISRLLAREMDGDITLRSTRGKGSVFTITVTLGQTAQPPRTPPDDIAVLDGKTVLVAEDNQTNRLLMRKYLAGLPIALDFARNGVEAVEKVRTLAPDIVLMDMAMPEMDGLTATREIRAAPGPQPRIIALTANAFASDKAACLAAGMDGFLSKPLRKTALLHALAARAGAAPAPVARDAPPPSDGPAMPP